MKGEGNRGHGNGGAGNKGETEGGVREQGSLGERGPKGHEDMGTWAMAIFLVGKETHVNFTLWTYCIECWVHWIFFFLFLAKVERPMALNLANDDDGGSQMEVAQKDSAESYPGTESTLLFCCHCLFVWFPAQKFQSHYTCTKSVVL